MDGRLLFWTWAFLNMGAVLAVALAGVRKRRRGEMAGHRRLMQVSVGLVLLFVAGYGLKLAVLGREALELWSAPDVWILRLHEACVATMLLGGGFALWRASALRRSRNFTRNPADSMAPGPVARSHRAAGWTALAGAVLGLLTAGLVLAGMYRRAGLL